MSFALIPASSYTLNTLYSLNLQSCNSFSFCSPKLNPLVSKPEELPLKLLSEPCVKLSLHTAPNYLAIGKIPYFQCANNFMSLCAISANQFVAFFIDLIVLYFLLTHFIRIVLIYSNILLIPAL